MSLSSSSRPSTSTNSPGTSCGVANPSAQFLASQEVQEICALVNIPPRYHKPVLTVSVLPSVSISPYPMNDILTKSQASKPSSNPSQPCYLTLDAAKQHFNQQQKLTRPHLTPDLLICHECEKFFETKEDMKWHQENKYGREDCIILQKMMLTNYYSKPVI